ncbi:MAG: NADH-quinone oxidoreductase subunit H [Syntrophobacteraceae bacterium]|nr:NADH-quinone oxidoreductase subunit H [Syntrophobacteraceae bacterium]
MNYGRLALPVLALALAPLLPGIINRTKAVVAGRDGQPLLQLYYDLAKLVRKGGVYSRTTSWVFRAGPVVGLVSAVAVLTVLPLGGASAPVSFPGDLILMAYLLGLMRFFTVIAALDTGSAFEGMGASREVQFSALAEPVLLMALATIWLAGRNPASPVHGFLFSLSAMYSRLSLATWVRSGPALLMVAGSLLVVFLAENSRVPFDDPNTHLELTMIHEVMVLDHSGPDFAMILYGASLKLWALGALLAGLLVPVRTGNTWLDAGAVILGLFVLAVLTGVIESAMARLRLTRVPQLLVSAGFLSTFALALILWS